jgi:hypothetical protein
MVQEADTGTRKYLDFSKDQVMPGGIPKDLEADKLAHGWRSISLTDDRLVEARFRQESGRVYFQHGWVRKGTEVLVPVVTGDPSVFDGFGVIVMCGNPVIIGEELFGW